MSDSLSLALLEVSNLAPSFIVADACSKMANIRIIGIESTDGAAQCIKLVGSVADVRAAAEHGMLNWQNGWAVRPCFRSWQPRWKKLKSWRIPSLLSVRYLVFTIREFPKRMS